MDFGFLNIYKPKGMTSHDVVSVLRRITKIKQIGHTGTLDPFAKGVLPVCIGKATRLIEYLKEEKEYLATVQFGASSTTYDIEGEITQKNADKLYKDNIVEILKTFEGEINQVPPIYSAIKVNGKKLYEYARKGQIVDIKPRKVTIEKLELKSFNEELQQAEILVKCSKGTYIRSLANDLGEKLGVGGYLIELVRTQSGKFRIEDSLQLENIDVWNNLINPLVILDLTKIDVCETDLEKIKHGMPIEYKNNTKLNNTDVILVYNNNTICATGTIDKEQIKLKKVFIQ